MPLMLHCRSGSGLCLITPPLSVQHDFPGTIKSCLIVEVQHQLHLFSSPPSPCFQSATVYLMFRPFEIFTRNPSILLPMHPEKLLRLPTYVRNHFFCDVRAVLPHSSKMLVKLLQKATLVTFQHMHYSLTKTGWITRAQFVQSH